MNYRAVIFDFDYTLGDATQAIYAGFCHAFSTMGRPVPQVEEVRRTVGLLAMDAYTQLSGDGSPEGRTLFYSLFHPVARDLQAQGAVDLLPGALELLQGLKAAGIPAAVVSSKNAQSVDGIVRSKGLSELLSCVVGDGVVATHKPDPAGTLYALEQLGVAPCDALYCGDTTIDANTARNAGASFCAVLNGTTPAEDFRDLPHVHIAPDLWELKDWLGI